MALSPWPARTAAVALAAATATLKAAVDDELTDERAQALGGAAAALVEEYAAAAPDVLKDEAVIRCAGWLHQAPSDGTRRDAAGPLDASYSPMMTGALRASGGMGLLTRWKIRRAGVIG